MPILKVVYDELFLVAQQEVWDTKPVSFAELDDPTQL